ncbi:hypothetical protein B0J18DRAFT_428758 [Chaetomium sp. MPI-SDFR-AT-0129]|nr:hypothetical protein B0J18DRAFT_428758 [Chaetomium sp. MPI-SDFR-AT-0129]
MEQIRQARMNVTYVLYPTLVSGAGFDIVFIVLYCYFFLLSCFDLGFLRLVPRRVVSGVVHVPLGIIMPYLAFSTT